MARAHSIYLVVDKTNRADIMACFTVKHEALSFMDKHDLHEGYELVQTRDGQMFTYKVISQ